MTTDAQITRVVNYRRRGDKGAWQAGLLGDDGVIELNGHSGPGDREPALGLLARGAGVVERGGAVLAREEIELGTPVLRPGKIVAAAGNYLDHIDEMPEDRGTIERQGFFLKAPTSLLPAGGTVRLPFPGRRTDYEGELAVVIGTRVSGLSEAQAPAAVLGYTCLIDVSLRGEEDRGFRKSFDTFTPLGEGIIPAAAVADLAACELTTTVSGEVRQRASLAQMVYGVPRLLAWISSVMTLEPGDVVATGTPSGVGPLIDGDEVTVAISGVGHLSVNVADR